MLKLSNTLLWVHDQDEALAFYTQKVGFEVRADVTLPELGDFRWLTVGPAAQEDFSVDDCQAAYEELVRRGVEFSQEPTQQPYGVDAGFRDPSGNSLRLTQINEAALNQG